MPARTTLRDVAERAGFSVTTVSQVLNDVPGKRIPDATRALVRAAAEELSYRPNRLAQGLRLQRSNTIGFVSDQIATSPYAGAMIQGAQDEAADHGVLLLMVNSGNDRALEEREIQALLERQVDGIVYAAEYHRVVELPANLRGAPVVLLDSRTADGSRWSVVPDEVGGAQSATAELLTAGHRRIVMINNVDDIPATALRLEGFRRAVHDAGRRVTGAMVTRCVSDSRGGYEVARALLDDRPSARPTALFCFNDRVAMGVYQAAADLRLRIPEDVSVVGFDNQLLIADSLRPGLTTVQLPHYGMGRWAVARLLEIVNAGADDRPQPQTLTCPLVRRGSVAPPPTGR